MFNNEVNIILNKIEALGFRDFEYLLIEEFEEHKEINPTSFHLFSKDEFENGQMGYRVDRQCNSVIGDPTHYWKETWFVIGYNDFGDPLFVDISKEDYPVMTVMHEFVLHGAWEPSVLFNSLDELIRNFEADTK